MATRTKTHRPEELASSLGVTGKVLRGYLRSTFPRPVTAKGSTWVVTDAQAKAARKHFLAKRGTAVTTPVRVTKPKASKPKASGVKVTRDPKRATVTPGTRAKATAGLPPTKDDVTS